MGRGFVINVLNIVSHYIGMGDYCTFIQNDDTKEPYILRNLKIQPHTLL